MRERERERERDEISLNPDNRPFATFAIFKREQICNPDDNNQLLSDISDDTRYVKRQIYKNIVSGKKRNRNHRQHLSPSPSMPSSLESL